MTKPIDRDKNGKVWWGRDGAENDLVRAMIAAVLVIVLFVAYLLS